MRAIHPNIAVTYYPFGMLMLGRTYTSEAYGYGFNGMQKDDEVSGSGNNLDFGARIYDSRLGRWMSVDPLAKKFESFTPYNFVTNNSINAIDPDGQDVVFLINKSSVRNRGHMAMLIQDSKGAWYFYSLSADGDPTPSEAATNKAFAGTITLEKMTKTTKAGDIVQMTKEESIEYVSGLGYDKQDNSTLKTSQNQDAKIYSNAVSLKSQFKIGVEKYKALTNNCASSCEDVVEGSKGTKTGIELPDYASNPLVRNPNDYYKEVKAHVPFLNRDVTIEFPKQEMDNHPPPPTPVVNPRKRSTTPNLTPPPPK